MNNELPFQIKQYVLDRIGVAATHRIPRSQILMSKSELHCVLDMVSDDIVIMLESCVHGLTYERIVVHKQWPRDWWQAVKERFAPAWFTRRYPVLYDRVDIDRQLYSAVCPHLDDDTRRTHTTWLAATHEAYVRNEREPTCPDRTVCPSCKSMWATQYRCCPNCGTLLQSNEQPG